ncbi:hypothetical protein BJX61DRAFT_490994 [Aspergillus egyptiacus]|nr:hypothetical protein BJX61DRAFT_490994 [Aspergillus egyptiacus]
MANLSGKDTGDITGATDPAPSAPVKRKPPKLRKKTTLETTEDTTSKTSPENVPEAAPERPNEPVHDASPQEQGHGDAEEPATSIYQQHGSEEEDESDTVSLSSEEEDEEDLRPPQETRRPQATRAIVLDREKDAPPEAWRRHGQRARQQQLPDITNTVDQAGGLVRSVATKQVGSVGETAGRVVESAVAERKEKDEQLRLRLDLNLDIEVQLKAKIHGDLTLQLL